MGETWQIASSALNTPIQSAFAYEPNTGERRLKSITHPANARSFGYTSAPENLIKQLTETTLGQSKTWQYEYDAIDRLQNANRSEFQYGYTLDRADNITRITAPEGARTYQHDAGNKISQTPYRYDGNGNRIEDGVRTYKWDAENRLIEIGYKAAANKKTEFRYDGQGRRIAIIETDGTNRTETRYGWCGDRICQARDGNDQPIAYYFSEGTFRPGPGATLGRMVGTREHYMRDRLGSVRDVLDEAGNSTARYDYDPYGNLISEPTQKPEFGYAGMHYHAPSGLYLTLYRAYDPRDGRWLSRDPIEETGGINLYTYVQGNPVSFVDPTGEIRLPDNPNGLPDGWQRDPGHRDPNGERWRHPGGDVLDWHKGRPGEPGWRGKDHWHHNGGDKHLPPGTEVPDPPDNENACGDTCEKVATVVVVGGVAYITYRCVRMIPSLFPPLWPTIPANLVVP